MKTYYQHTRVLVRLDSHLSGTVNLSKDVVELKVQKNTKAMGKWQIHLVPRRNYLNIIYPNDLINIYVDTGEFGVTRLMMGYVDRIQRSEVVDETGTMKTVFIIIGSDFQKAIDRTHIYQNDYMRQRIDERFFNKTLSGSLRSGGIIPFGSPADFVRNFLNILLGFGNQWRLPKSYSQENPKLADIKKERVQRAKNKLPNFIKENLTLLGIDPALLDTQPQLVLQQVNDLSKPTPETSPLVTIEDAPRSGVSVELNQLIAATRRRLASQILDSGALSAYTTVYLSSVTPESGIVDILNTDFIEDLAIDGWVHTSTVWQAGNKTLGKFLYGHSNEIVNELIFDLRPVSKDGQGLSSGKYSTAPDDLGINVNGMEGFAPSDIAGVEYAPAVVFREYPWSVVGGLDILKLLATEVLSELGGVSFVPFGPVFSLKPNTPGRHIYDLFFDNLASNNKFFARSIDPNAYADDRPIKHLDVVVIENTEVVNADIGRSDNEIMNLFGVYPRNFGQLDLNIRSQLSNFTPIINKASITRNGLRVYDTTTEFANLSPSTAQSEQINASIRQRLSRWMLLMDHWYQHNGEYLSGTITLRGRPDIRVGYRLDWKDRNESYYVEGVSHTWKYPGAFSTSVSLSRGQPNNPFPAYIPPELFSEDNVPQQYSSGDRTETGRLAKYFKVKDTDATANATNNTDEVYEADRNVLDEKFNANGDGVAEYAEGTAAGRFLEGEE